MSFPYTSERIDGCTVHNYNDGELIVELFLRNLLLGETNELKNRYLHIRWKEQKQHIQELFETFGYDQFFGRTEVMKVLSITASPASALIKKMLEMKLIYPFKGKGKGKYLFQSGAF